jgi:hypothetical protein
LDRRRHHNRVGEVCCVDSGRIGIVIERKPDINPNVQTPRGFRDPKRESAAPAEQIDERDRRSVDWWVYRLSTATEKRLIRSAGLALNSRIGY